MGACAVTLLLFTCAGRLCCCADLSDTIQQLEQVSGITPSDEEPGLNSRFDKVCAKVLKLNAQLKAATCKLGMQADKHSSYKSRVTTAIGNCSKPVVQRAAGDQSASSGTASNTPAAAGAAAAAAGSAGSGLLAAGPGYNLPLVPTAISPKSMLLVRVCDQTAPPSGQDAVPSGRGAPPDQTSHIVAGLKQHISCLYQATLADDKSVAAVHLSVPLESVYSSYEARIGLQLDDFNKEVCKQVEQQRLAELVQLPRMQQQGGADPTVTALGLLRRGVICSADYAAVTCGAPLLPHPEQGGTCGEEQPQQGPAEGLEQHGQDDACMQDADQGKPSLTRLAVLVVACSGC